MSDGLNDLELASGVWFDSENGYVVLVIDRVTASFTVDEFDQLVTRVKDAHAVLTKAVTTTMVHRAARTSASSSARTDDLN